MIIDALFFSRRTLGELQVYGSIEKKGKKEAQTFILWLHGEIIVENHCSRSRLFCSVL